MIDLPPNVPEFIVCSIKAAEEYQISPEILLAVAQAEGGKPGQWVKNSNGTFDVGPMQFNTAYLKTLEKYGITTDHVGSSGCFPYKLAAWRIKQHITQDRGDFWTKVANYHSKTPRFNAVYREKLIVFANEWRLWLQSPTTHTLPTKVVMKVKTQTPQKSVRERYPTFEDFLKAHGFQ